MDEIFGEDIALDEHGQAKVAANGELMLTDGTETGLQDIRLRLETPLGTLFYDADFGSLVHKWMLDENTLSSRMGLAAEVAKRVKADPRVAFNSVACRVTAWDEQAVSLDVGFSFINDNHPRNLVVTIGRSALDMVIKDGDTR